MQRSNLLVPLALLCAACTDHTPRPEGWVDYFMSEAEALGGTAGSCLHAQKEGYVPQMHQQFRYAVGARLATDVFYCCDNLQAQVAPLGGWSLQPHRPPSGELSVNMTADLPTTLGGFKVIANAKELSPSFQLTTTDDHSSIWFERATCPGTNDCIVPGFVSEIRIPRTRAAAVAATLRTPSGEHICGTVPTLFTVEPPGLFSVEPWYGANYSNMPYWLVAGGNLGSGTFRIATTTGKAVEGLLQIIVE